ncbi:hypothetical protein U0070_012781 [Myodes glareolus]|uniref:Large ribosomal subunit protein uL23 N-terminal domain-containing protein n=1 Tax=Myodes glareolus TaxID=447135 RepID=A0AAW0I8T3_MYOGA
MGTNGDDGGVRIDGGDDDHGHDGCGGLNSCSSKSLFFKLLGNFLCLSASHHSTGELDLQASHGSITYKLVTTIGVASTLKPVKALKAKRAVLKGIHSHKKKICTSPTFRRPKTLRLWNREEDGRQQHTVFTVDVKANKHQIKQAVKKLYDTDVAKVNTLIRPNREKKEHFESTSTGVQILQIKGNGGSAMSCGERQQNEKALRQFSEAPLMAVEEPQLHTLVSSPKAINTITVGVKFSHVVPRYRLASKNHAVHIGYFCSKALMPLGRAGISQHGGDPDKMEPIPYIGNRPCSGRVTP